MREDELKPDRQKERGQGKGERREGERERGKEGKDWVVVGNGTGTPLNANNITQKRDTVVRASSFRNSGSSILSPPSGPAIRQSLLIPHCCVCPHSTI